VRPRRLAACLAPVALALAASACGDGGGTATTTNTTSASTATSAPAGIDPDEVSRAVQGRVVVRVSGSQDFEFEGDVDLRLVFIDEPEVSALRFLSVGTERYHPTGRDSGHFQVAFDLVGFRGARTYELPAIGGATVPTVDSDNPDANAAAAGFSRPYLRVTPSGDPAEDREALRDLVTYENPLTPCTLEVTDAGRSGTLHCEELAAADPDSVVTLDMRWTTE
jgi:hypothetical protein